ncbi:MAG: hypothetical protein HZB18_10850 [Chloroflexi bacterium]|nr:hypothetical protein [Chloroflexota bacterium]
MRNKISIFKKSRRISLTLAIVTALLVFTSALAADEMLDPNFGTNGIVMSSFEGINNFTSRVILQTDGKIIMSGYYQNSTPFVARYNSNGTVDTSFGINGSFTPTIGAFSGSRVAIQSDGKLIVAGSSNDSFAVARYDSNGISLDGSFGVNGVAKIPSDSGDSRYRISDLVIQADQRIIVVGTHSNQGNFTNFAIARFNTDGTQDFFRIIDKVDFPNNRFNSCAAVAIQTDGKIVMSGSMLDDDAHEQISLARLNQDGSFDTSSFGTNGKGTVTAALPDFIHGSGALALQQNGKIVVAGTVANDANTIENPALARFNSNGALDTTFGGTGIVTTDFGSHEKGSDLLIQPDGKIILVGTIYASNFSDILLVRYNSDGTLDNSFGENGKIIKDLGSAPDFGNGITIQPDGMIVVAGSSNGRAFLARYILEVSTHQTVSTTFKSRGVHDGWVLEAGENSNSGGSLDRLATTFNVGDDARDRQYRSILSFNTASLPDNAVIMSAHLDIKRQSFVGVNPFTTHGDLLMDIRAGTFSNNLNLQTSDFNSAGSPGTSQERFAPLTSSWYTTQFSSANLRFINKYGITQFRLLFAKDDNDDMGADYIKFFSGNSVNGNLPKLIIGYFVP